MAEWLLSQIDNDNLIRENNFPSALVYALIRKPLGIYFPLIVHYH